MDKQLYDIILYYPDGSKFGFYHNVKDFQFAVGGRLFLETEEGKKIWTTLPSFITEIK